MSTKQTESKPGTTLFGKTRRAVLSLLYGRADEEFYIRYILRSVSVGHGSVQRELKRLAEARILRRTARGRQVYYQANRDSPIFPELKSLITKTAGVGDILLNALAPLAERIKIAFIFGSVAKGEETRRSDIDLLVVGDVSFMDVVTNLQAAQKAIGREINPTVYPSKEFESKIKANHHFLSTLLDGPKISLIGDENELSRLAKKRLAGRS
jgi:predicted nucleotidyltransferase